MRNTASPGKWGDREFVKVWDSQPTNPLKAEQLDILANVVRDNWKRGSRILDLGCGTGKTEALILERLPVARFVCVDRSEVMLGFARERLQGFGSQSRFVTTDLDRLESVGMPGAPFRFILSVDVVHELPDAAKARLFRLCRRNLTQDGMLLILDRIALDLHQFRRPMASVLGRLQHLQGSHSGQLSDHFADPRRPDHEHPLALEPYLRMFRACGLAPAILHLHFHKALFVARPAETAVRRPR
jgi:SAM-dependent methyltransferase